jgi:hypothetical protein
MIWAIAGIATLGICAVFSVVFAVALHFGVERPEVVGPAAGALAWLIMALLESRKERRTKGDRLKGRDALL